MATSQDAAAALEQAAANTPFVVTATPQGAEVRWNIADEQWGGPTTINHAGRVAGVDVVVDEAQQSYSAGTSLYEVDASAGPGGLAYGRRVQTGAVRQIEVHKEIGLSGETSGFSFDTKELTDFVDSTMQQLGLQKTRSQATKIGLYIGIGAAALALVTAVSILLALL